MRVHLLAVLSAVLLLFTGMPTNGLQVNRPPTMAAVTDGNVVIYPLRGASIQVTDYEEAFISDVEWGPGGGMLAYVAPLVDDAFVRAVYFTDATGSFPTELVRDVRSTNIEFLPDGRITFIKLVEDVEVTFDMAGPQRDLIANQLLPYGLYAADPMNPAAEPELLTVFLYAEGCGGGGGFPPQVNLMNDLRTNIGVTFYRLLDDGSVLHSIICVRERRGLGRTGATPADFSAIITGSGYEAVSADNTRAFAIRNSDGRPVWIDLTTDTVNDIPLPDALEPINATWGPDNVLYFSAREVVDTLDYTNGGQVDLVPSWGDIAPSNALPDYRATIHRFDPVTGELTEILAQRAWGFGEMQVRDGVLYVNHHSDVTAWADPFINGTESDNLYDRSNLRVTLLGLDLETGMVTIIGQDRLRFIIQPDFRVAQ